MIVDDDGPGIPPHALERIFERFYTDRPEQGFGQNSGLGLSISRQIVEAHGGRIWAENRPGTPQAASDEDDDAPRRGRALRRRPAGDRPMSATPAGWTALHATALVVGESGVLLRGPSGAGKSSLALALIWAARERAGFAALIADDRVFARAFGDRLVARGAPEFAGRIERRCEGLIAVAAEPAAVDPAGRRSRRTGRNAAAPARRG